MRKSLIGAAGTAVVITGATAAIAVGQTTNPGPYNPAPTVTTPGQDLPSPGDTARAARDAAAEKLGTLAAGRAFLAGRSITVTVPESAPGSYSLSITRGISGTGSVSKQKVASRKVTIAKGKKTLGGTTIGTLKIRVKSTKAGRKALRRIRAKRVTVKEAVTYKNGSASRTSKRKLKLRLR